MYWFFFVFDILLEWGLGYFTRGDSVKRQNIISRQKSLSYKIELAVIEILLIVTTYCIHFFFLFKLLQKQREDDWKITLRGNSMQIVTLFLESNQLLLHPIKISSNVVNSEKWHYNGSN